MFGRGFLVTKQESECTDPASLQSVEVTLLPAHPAALRRACGLQGFLIPTPVTEA